MKNDYNYFFEIMSPRKGYHCPNGIDELHHEMNLYFTCECGEIHSVTGSFAHIVFPVENKTIYSCPNNELIFILVKPTGIFKIKGLKTIASYTAKSEKEMKLILNELENRKKKA